MELVTRPHVENFIKWSATRPEVLVLSADLTNSCEVGKWRDTYPDRFITAGMAEQNMLSVAGGLAREGFVPFIHTFAVFIYRRAYDQLAMPVTYPNLKVRLVGFLPGIATPGGVTHQAIEDIAIMRTTPNMTVVETGDATEVESVLDAIEHVEGPVYVRLLRGEMPRLFPADEPMQVGQSRLLNDGDDVTVITAGITTEEALRATQALEAKGVRGRPCPRFHPQTLRRLGARRCRPPGTKRRRHPGEPCCHRRAGLGGCRVHRRQRHRHPPSSALGCRTPMPTEHQGPT